MEVYIGAVTQCRMSAKACGVIIVITLSPRLRHAPIGSDGKVETLRRGRSHDNLLVVLDKSLKRYIHWLFIAYFGKELIRCRVIHVLILIGVI